MTKKKHWMPKIKTIELIREFIEPLSRTDERKYYSMRALLWDLEAEIEQALEEAIYDATGNEPGGKSYSYAELEDYVDEIESALQEVQYIVRRKPR